jgi:uncharacterized protein (TIGR00299 family) protein
VTTVAWWHCFAGVAGDMALGSLIDAGADLGAIERELVALPVGGWSLETEDVLRAGVAATRVKVKVSERSVVRTYSHIVGLITEARLPERARTRALATFEKLATVESRLHRRPMAQVHFHEVGSTDAIIDIVGTCVALEVLGVDEVRASAVAQGTGMVSAAHGLLPIPAPAVVGLLADAGAPTYGTSIPMELATPTGAALLAALCSGFGPMPAFEEVTAAGYGAGSREIDGMPNALQVVIGRAVAPASSGAADGAAQPVLLLEANVDDVTGEILGSTIASLMAAGALDAWVTAVTAKKGRPGHVVAALCEESTVGRLRSVLADETGTLGVRVSEWRRWPSARQVDSVEVAGHQVRVKRGPSRVKAEHDDAVRVASVIGLPVREVARLAEEAAHRRYGTATAPTAEGPPADAG